MIDIYSIGDQGIRTPVNFKSWWFPGGENGFSLMDDCAAKSLHTCHWAHIIVRIQCGNDLLEFLSAVDAIQRYAGCGIQVSIPYWPAARQDRVANPGEALTTKIYADIFNSLNLQFVQLVDPHSEVSLALIHNSWLYPIHEKIKLAIENCNPDFIISPDAGASKRIETYLKKINCTIPVIQCLKKRDTLTGRLSGFQVLSTKEELAGKKCLILDDICDGGGTFIGICEELDELDAGDTYLYVTHGIFSKGYSSLLENFTKIYTTDSFIQDEFCIYDPPSAPDDKRLIIYKLYE